MSGSLPKLVVRTYMARGTAAVGAVALGLVLGRIYGPHGLGLFALSQAVLAGGSIIAQQGLANTLMRFLQGEGSDQSAWEYLGWACRRTLLVSLVLSLSITLARNKAAQLLAAPQLAPLLMAMAVALPAIATALVLAGFLKAMGKPAIAATLETGSVTFVAAMVTLMMHLLAPKTGVWIAGIAFAVAAWVVLAEAVVLSFRRAPAGAVRAALHFRSPLPAVRVTARAFFVVGIAQFVNEFLFMFVIGLLMSSRELGLYKAAERASVLVAFVLFVTEAVLPPRFANAYRAGDRELLAHDSQFGAIVGTILALPFSLVCLVWPGIVLSAFGPGFAGAETTLRILAIGQTINVMAGSVVMLLAMCDHERVARDLVLLTSCAGLVLGAALAPPLGAAGAAIASASAVVVQNALAIVIATRRLRLNPVVSLSTIKSIWGSVGRLA